MANKETSKNTGIILDTESRKTSIRVLRIGMVVVSLFFVVIIFLPRFKYFKAIPLIAKLFDSEEPLV